MKKFFEEYGFILIAVVVVCGLIVTVKTVNSDTIKGKIDAWQQSFKDTGDKNIQEIEAPERIASLESGNIITLANEKQYKILRKEGNLAFVLSMGGDVPDMNYWNDGEEQTDWFSSGQIKGIKYAGSNIDNYLENTYYPSLPFKEAIVPQNISQGMYIAAQGNPSGNYIIKGTYTENGTPAGDTYKYYIYSYYGDNVLSVGSRHCYILDIKEIADYLGKDGMSAVNLANMFGLTVGGAQDLWLRSSTCDTTSNLIRSWHFDEYYGTLTYSKTKNTFLIRPVFWVDLSKTSFKFE